MSSKPATVEIFTRKSTSSNPGGSLYHFSPIVITSLKVLCIQSRVVFFLGNFHSIVLAVKVFSNSREEFSLTLIADR